MKEIYVISSDWGEGHKVTVLTEYYVCHSVVQKGTSFYILGEDAFYCKTKAANTANRANSGRVDSLKSKIKKIEETIAANHEVDEK